MGPADRPPEWRAAAAAATLGGGGGKRFDVNEIDARLAVLSMIRDDLQVGDKLEDQLKSADVIARWVIGGQLAEEAGAG